MTTKQAALLAAVGTTLRLFPSMFLPFLTFALDNGWGRLSNTASMLPTQLMYVVWAAALPVFFFFVYRSAPPLAIPEKLRRATLVAAIATGLSAALTTCHEIWTVVRLWNDGYPILRAEDLLQRLRGTHLLEASIWLFGAIAVPAFFLVLSRSKAGEQSVNPALKMAAVYAGLVMMFSVANQIYGRISTEIFMSTHQALLAAAPGRTHTLGIWYRILSTSLGLFYSGSLAWFFFQFYRTVPTAQSNQRLISGE